MFYHLGKPFTKRGPFWYGDSDWSRTYRPVEWADHMGFKGGKCPATSRHTPPSERVGDLDVVLPSPKIHDFLWTVASECIVTDRVLRLFQEAELTGYGVRPVTVSRVKRLRKGSAEQLSPLWEIVVTGSGGDADPSCGIRLHYECKACGLKMYSSFRRGILVDEKNWDGSDFFTVNGYTKFVMVTERVADLIRANKLTNCALILPHELRWIGSVRAEDYKFE